MPAGRPVNHDKRIAMLTSQLKTALIAREQERLIAHVDGLVSGLGNLSGLDTRGGFVGSAARRKRSRPKGSKNKPKSTASAAGRARQIAAMKKYWAKRRASAKKGQKPAKVEKAEAAAE
jgi:hypothetical protein